MHFLILLTNVTVGGVLLMLQQNLRARARLVNVGKDKTFASLP